MDFRHPEDSIGQTYLCDSFKLLPAAWTKLAAQSHDIPNSAADRYRFNLFDFTHHLKMHNPILRIIEQGSISGAESARGEAFPTACVSAGRMRGEGAP